MPLINIDKFVGGLHSSNITSEIQLNPTDCTDVMNVEYYPRGSISKRGGYTTYTMSATPISGVMKIFPWKDATFSNVILVYTTASATTSADVYTLSLSSNVATTTSVMTAGHGAKAWYPSLSADQVHVVSYGGSAVAVGGNDSPPLVYNTAATKAIPWSAVGYGASYAGSACPSGAKYIAAWGQYLFAANVLSDTDLTTRHRSRIRWNSNGLMTAWPTTYYIDLDPDDGDEITGMKLLNDYLVVFKRNKIFIIYWQGGATLFKEQRRSATVGCVAGRTIVEKDGKLYFLADDGFYSFDGTNTTELSKKIKDIVYQIDMGNLQLHNAEIYEEHRQIWFAVGKTMETDGVYDALAAKDKYCNRILVYDWELDNWTKYDIPVTAMANVLNTAEQYWYDLPSTSTYDALTETIGSYAGTESPLFLLGHSKENVTTPLANSGKKSCLSQFTDGSSDVSTTGIDAYWQSIWFDLGDPTINKRYTRWTIMVNQESTSTGIALTANLHEDFDSNTYTMDDGTASTYSIYLTGDNRTANRPMECRIDTSRTCRAFQIKLRNAENAQTFTVHKIVVDGMAKGRTKV